jgi:hypothetical protein
MTKKSWDIPNNEKSQGDFGAYVVNLPKQAGISWGSDLSFRWVYVIDLDPNGEAFRSGRVRKVVYFISLSMSNFFMYVDDNREITSSVAAM